VAIREKIARLAERFYEPEQNLTKDQRYYRHHRKQRLKESRAWKKAHPARNKELQRRCRERRKRRE
jgi:hypothetical protein